MQQRIAFTDISRLVETVLSNSNILKVNNLQTVLGADAKARAEAEHLIVTDAISANKVTIE